MVPLDYTFERWDTGTNAARPVPLSKLFEDGKDTLFLYSFMFNPGEDGPLAEGCPSCTSIIDGIDGIVPHISQLINFAVVAKVPIERFRAHAKSRGWRHARATPLTRPAVTPTMTATAVDYSRPRSTIKQ